MSDISISVDEIIEMHLKNKLKNVNRTMNAFMIYRKNCALQNPNLSRIRVSKLASRLWKNESTEIKDRYKRMAGNNSSDITPMVQNSLNIDQNTLDTIYHNNTNIYYCQQTNPHMDQNPFKDINQGTSFYNSSPSNSLSTIYSRQQSVNMGQNFHTLTTYMDQNITCSGPLNIEQRLFEYEPRYHSNQITYY
ncbi:9360_t:CDS:2 [Diversispora eburnea]|uniref:9360_t:CDS:1 n=1 Tax=Diversispora eburnea TaxID=1213867 RepID=A0A9N8ZFI0_9GLOM|nr:9360_t:CDS:2 [Diversispora eburnea]